MSKQKIARTRKPTKPARKPAENPHTNKTAEHVAVLRETAEDIRHALPDLIVALGERMAISGVQPCPSLARLVLASRRVDAVADFMQREAVQS